MVENEIPDQDEDLNNPSHTAIMFIAGNSDPRKIAKESWDIAFKLLDKFQKGESIDPESDLNKALSNFLKCFWFYKERRIYLADIMHRVGRTLCMNDKCKLKFDGKNYYTDCPNELLHRDFGYSVRALEEYVCSICGLEPLECEHISSYFYDDIECKIISDVCNICLNSIDECEHQLGKKYEHVEAVRVISNLEIITFDMVKEPDMVFTRMTKIPFGKDFILESLTADPDNSDFKYGESELFCSHCIDCEGYDPERTSKLFNS